MTAITNVIEKINKSKTFIEVFTDLSNWVTEYKQYAKQIHPDVCHEKGAKDALSKLNSYKEELEKGKTHQDDAGTVTYKICKTTIDGNKPVLEVSLKNFNKLLSLKDKIDLDFQRYIPISAKLENSTLPTGLQWWFSSVFRQWLWIVWGFDHILPETIG